MTSNTQINLLYLPFNISGLKVDQRSSTKYFFQKYINLPVFLVLYALICVNLCHCDGILEVTETLQSMCSYGHALVRKTLLLLNSSNLEDLHFSRRFLWQYDLFGKKLGDKFRKKMSIITWICFTIPGIAIVVVVFFAVSPFLYQDLDLPQPCWVPTPALRPIIHFLQVYYFLELGTVSCVLDFTYLITCGELEIQFSLIKNLIRCVKIKEQNEEISFMMLKKCAIHHNMLLKIHKKLQETFSVFFLFTYLLTVLGIFVQLYLINEVELSRGQMSFAVFYIVSVVADCSYHFLAASNVEEEADGLVDIIYGIDWYNLNDVKILTHIHFMIVNAHRSLELKGVGLFKINRTVLVQILRIGFSISTLLRQK